MRNVHVEQLFEACPFLRAHIRDPDILDLATVVFGEAATLLIEHRLSTEEEDRVFDYFNVLASRATEAQRVVREIEYNLWFVAKALGAGKERYAKKSHVYIFEGEGEWKSFLSESETPPWSGSFAYGDNLFLHVGGPGEGFDSHTLAHETTHAVVARLYEGGVRRFYLAGSLGMEDPAHVNRLFGRLVGDYPAASFGFHIHNLSGMATANIVAALDAGVDWLESAICGIGGGIAMPKELGAVGNFPTEDLIAMLSVMGVRTGIDLERVVEASSDVAHMLDIAPQSHAARGATRKNVMKTGRKV